MASKANAAVLDNRVPRLKMRAATRRGSRRPLPANANSPGKRLFDVASAVAALIVLFPLMLFVWLAVRLTTPGPGLFWSERVGLGGSTFLMPKFRTMRANAPVLPREILVAAPYYVTALGRVLRRWSIDELPQLVCVLFGQMSLVGPRPLPPGNPAQVARERFPASLAVRPGLSGLAQVSGRNLMTARRKARLDAFYARNRNGLLDCEIIVHSFVVVLTGRGFV